MLKTQQENARPTYHGEHVTELNVERSNLRCLWTLILLELESSLFSNIADDQWLSVATKVVGGRVSFHVYNYVPSIIPLIIKTRGPFKVISSK